ncbi:MAG: diguanylate cyclase [Lachnospiraceae bacterium]|nr:diguanylate cyclase [Lachnospiraceae bacterium]
MAGLFDKLTNLKEEDQLTGTLTRNAGMERIQKYIAKHPDTVCVFLFVDGDRFKQLIDLNGHQVRDLLYIQTAKVLKDQFQDKGIIFRFDEDEFAVFYTDTTINEVSGKLKELMISPDRQVELSQEKIPFTLSIGAVMYPAMGQDFDLLMELSVDALYRAKYEGRNCYRFNTEGRVTRSRDGYHFDVDSFSQGMPGGFFVYKAEGNEDILYASESVARIFDCETVSEFRDFVGNSFRGIVFPEDYEKIKKVIDKQQFEMPQNVKKIDFVRYRIKTKNGTIKEVDDFGRLAYNESYGLVYYVFIVDVHYLNAVSIR